MDWRTRAKELKPGKTWEQTGEAIRQEFFPQYPIGSRTNMVRQYIRRETDAGRFADCKPTNEAKPEVCTDTTAEKSSTEMKSDGTLVSNKLIEIMDGEDITPDMIMQKHGLDSSKWQVIAYRNNYWHAQMKGGTQIVMYQSRLTVKPVLNGVSYKDVEDYFADKDFRIDKPVTIPTHYDPSGEVLEICLPDLHSGLLAWHEETGDDYDIHIAKERFNYCLSDIIERCKGRRFKKIVFVTLGDILHIDNDNQTTTKGTFQQADGRTPKIFRNTLDMLIDGITVLGGLAPVDVVYVSGNHDRTTGYMLLVAVEMAFRNDNNITFDTVPDPQKFKLFGDVLIGWTHGDMPPKNMTKWLQGKARRELGTSRFAEIHAGHFHSTKTREKALSEEENEGIVIRHLPSICSSSFWEHQQAFGESVKTVISFVWNEKSGLREIWHSNI